MNISVFFFLFDLVKRALVRLLCMNELLMYEIDVIALQKSAFLRIVV